MNKQDYPKPFDPTTAVSGKLYWDRQKECRVRFVAMASANAVFEIVKGNSIIAREKDGRVFSNIHNTPDDIVIHWEDDIAPGYNPLGLTNGQVGEGFRLADPAKDVIDTRTEWWNVDSRTWVPTNNKPVYGSILTYRIPINPPKKQVTLDARDFPLGKMIYIRHKKAGDFVAHLVTSRTSDRIWFSDITATYSDISDTHEYTTDNGATWKPCWKEV